MFVLLVVDTVDTLGDFPDWGWILFFGVSVTKRSLIIVRVSEYTILTWFYLAGSNFLLFFSYISFFLTGEFAVILQPEDFCGPGGTLSSGEVSQSSILSTWKIRLGLWVHPSMT